MTFSNSENAETLASSTKLSVLLVDDIQENLDMLADVLEDLGYNTISCQSGSEALQVFRTEKVHLIITDAMMPKMDGFQLCKEVKKLPESVNVPFIIYTGDYIDEEDQEFATEIGVDRYVMKTGGVQRLVEAVNDVSEKVYGFRSPDEGIEGHHLDEQEFLEKHNAVLVKKLEQKMTELELYAEVLSLRNRELQTSEARYRSLFEHANIAIYIIDRENAKVLDSNQEGIKLLGYTREQLIGLELFPFKDASQFLTMLQELDNSISSETVLKNVKGEDIEAEINMVPLLETGDRRVKLFVRNITEEKKMRAQLLQAEKMTVMGRLASGIAHEIRNPLAAITLNLQFLMKKYETGFEDFDALECANEAANRVQQVIEKTLSLARPTPPQLKKENINDIVNRSLWFVNISMQQRNLHSEMMLREDLPQITVDAKQIQQVLLNILQNAIEASPPDGVIEVSTGRTSMGDQFEEGKADAVLVSVRDHGVGVSSEQFKRLFEPFSTTKSAGTGLGLALSKHIMDRHQARIRIEPAPGGGTAAHLIFPSNLTNEGARHA